MDRLSQYVISSPQRVLMVLVLACLAAYAVMLPTSFKTLDDQICIIENQDIRSISRLKEIFTTSFFKEGPYYRPLVYVSFMAEYHLFKLNSFFYNFDNLIIHILTAFAVFLIMRELLMDSLLSFWISFLFAIHPVHWECVSNIPGRAILLCALFFVYSFLFYLYGRKHSPKGQGWFLLSFIFFILSLLSKETAIMLPVVIASFTFLTTRCSKRDWGVVFIYFMIAVMYIFWRKHLNIHSYVHWDSIDQMFLSFGSFLAASFDFTQRLILPFNLYYDHSNVLIEHFLDWRIMLGYFAWAMILILILINRKKIGPVVLFFLSWAIFNFALVAQIIPLHGYGVITTADHFWYLPSIGAIAVLVIYFRKLYSYLILKKIMRESILKVCIVFYCLFLLFTLISQNLYASQEIAMFKDSLKYNPNNFRIRTSLAAAYTVNKRYEQAQQNYLKALELEPNDPRALIGYAATFSNTGNYAQAIKQLEKVVDPGQQYQALYNTNLNFAYTMLLKQYLKMLDKDPNDARVYYSMGVYYLKFKKYPEGIKALEKSLELNPDYRNAYYNLAAGYKLQNDFDKALQAYNKALKIPGDNSGELVQDGFIYVNMAEIFLALKDEKSARKYYNLAINAGGLPQELIDGLTNYLKSETK